MSNKIELAAELRQDVGKGASRRLRRSGNAVPGILYGGVREPINLTFKYNELNKAMEAESFYSQILNLSFDGQDQQAVVRDLQRHPATGRVQHIDFLRIRADRMITVSVPIHFLNEETNAAVKAGGSISHTMNEVEVSCLPGDLPEFLELDIAGLEEGHALHLSDIKMPEGVTIVALALGEDHDQPVASVVPKRAEVEEVDEEVAGGDADAGDASADASEGDED